MPVTTGGLVNLAFSTNDEVQQDTARALANLCSNEETHYRVYKQGALTALMRLSKSSIDVTQRYASMGLRFLSANPEIRNMIVKDGHVDSFVALANSQVRYSLPCFNYDEQMHVVSFWNIVELRRWHFRRLLFMNRINH